MSQLRDIENPTWVYHSNKPAKIVSACDTAKLYIAGWADSPVKIGGQVNQAEELVNSAVEKFGEKIVNSADELLTGDGLNVSRLMKKLKLSPIGSERTNFLPLYKKLLLSYEGRIQLIGQHTWYFKPSEPEQVNE